MNRYKKLAKNSGLFAIGEFSTKLLGLLLIPFYTHMLSTAQYGTVDMLTSTIRLVLPFSLLCLHEAILRYAMMEDQDKPSVYTTATVGVLAMALLCGLGYFLFKRVEAFHGLWKYFYAILLLESINQPMIQYLRATGRIDLFVSKSIIFAVMLILSNVFLLYFMRMGTEGYLLSMIVAHLTCTFFLIIIGRIYRHFEIGLFSFSLLKSMLRYSVPLVLTQMIWWVINASDRYIILYFNGVADNGIYALAHKIPTIIESAYQIFHRAWQMSAIEEYNSEDRSQFFSKIYNFMFTALILVASLLILIIKPIIMFISSESFHSAWKYIPFLTVASVFSGLANLVGTQYVAAKKTDGAFTTSLIGAIVNLILTIVMTPIWGMYGTSFATMASFMLLWFIRVRDTRKFIVVQCDYRRFAIVTALLVVQACVAILPVWYSQILQLAPFGCMAILQKSEIAQMVAQVRTMARRSPNGPKEKEGDGV